MSTRLPTLRADSCLVAINLSTVRTQRESIAAASRLLTSSGACPVDWFVFCFMTVECTSRQESVRDRIVRRNYCPDPGRYKNCGRIIVPTQRGIAIIWGFLYQPSVCGTWQRCRTAYSVPWIRTSEPQSLDFAREGMNRSPAQNSPPAAVHP